MKKLVIELCCVIVLAACGNGKEQNTVEEDSTAKALLQGVWIDDETELPLMHIEGDTIYYADPQNIPVSFKIIRDTIYVYGSNTVTYKIDRQTEYSFWFHSLADEIVKLHKSYLTLLFFLLYVLLRLHHSGRNRHRADEAHDPDGGDGRQPGPLPAPGCGPSARRSHPPPGR